MKILAVSDLHGNYQLLIQYMKKNRVDLVIIAGDITHFGPPELAEEILNEISTQGVPVLAIPGNCDPATIHSEIENSQAVNIHARGTIIKDVGICGFGGSNPTPFNTPLEFEEIEIYDEARKAMDGISHQKLTLLVTHAPPYGTQADLLPSGEHAGSKSIRKVIEEFQPNLNICGHIHESRGTDQIGNTQIVNPGQLAQGYGCLINLEEQEDDDSKVKTEIIKLNSQ